MSDIIHKRKIETFLKKGGEIGLLIEKPVQQELKRVIIANQTNWVKISSLPENTFKAFENKMKEDCDVREVRMTKRPNSGPYVAFKQENGRIQVLIDDKKSNKGVTLYRKCMAVVAYFTGIKGGIIKPTYLENGDIFFSEEDWILISIATRYCLMPPKLIKKVYLLTKMHKEAGALEKGKTFKQAFVDHLLFQTRIPDWAVPLRLKELSFSSQDYAKMFPPCTIDEMLNLYRENGGYVNRAE